jgi:hypothetical protein
MKLSVTNIVCSSCAVRVAARLSDHRDERASLR